MTRPGPERDDVTRTIPAAVDAPVRPIPAAADLTEVIPVGTLGSYQIVERLDADGLSLKAYEPRLRRFVAIRLLSPELAADPAARRHFVKAVKSAASVDHENVLTIHAVDEAGDQPFYVAEWVGSATLAGKASLELREAVSLGHQAAAGLAAVHARGLAHGDLRPESVLVEEGTGHVKLPPPRLAGEGAGPSAAQRDDLTALGTLLTTLAPKNAPEWLRSLVESLKGDPSRPAPTAEQAAETLRKQLAALQPRPAHARPPRPAVKGRPLMWLALLLLAGVGALAFTEATGRTVILERARPMLTGQAALLIEMEDPEAQVAIAGQEGVWSEPGTHQVPLERGTYLVRVSRPGRPVQEKEVTLGWGTRLSFPIAAEARPARTKPFALLSRRGFVERDYPTLAEAAALARKHDIIEIHGDGPFKTPSIDLGKKPLTIRAAVGFRPVIEFADVDEVRAVYHLHTMADLVLEGLDLRITGLPDPKVGGNRIVVAVNSGRLHAANCRFVVRTNGVCIHTHRSLSVTIRNCELLRQYHGWGSALWIGSAPAAAAISVDNCVIAGSHFGVGIESPEAGERPVSLTVRGSVFATASSLLISARQETLPPEDGGKASPLYDIDMANAVFEVREGFFRYNQHFKIDGNPVTGAQLEAALPRMFRWKMRDCLVTEGHPLLDLRTNLHTVVPGARRRTTLADWDSFWGLPAGHSLGEKPAFAANVASKLEKPETLTPADFTLAEDGPGTRHKGGRDLGPDLTLVGPGPAYERWKKTPEYREWLAATAPAKGAAK